MVKSRAYIKRLLHNLKTLKDNYQQILKDMPELADVESVIVVDHFSKLIEILKKEKSSLPTGYRYTGPFYVRQSYGNPNKFEKYDGVVYMREDLISWLIEKGVDPPDPCYHRNIFKEPKEGCELTKEDAEPIFEENKGSN